jgi:hypothetical protein
MSAILADLEVNKYLARLPREVTVKSLSVIESSGNAFPRKDRLPANYPPKLRQRDDLGSTRKLSIEGRHHVRGYLGKERRDLSTLREPIHVIFANWQFDAAGAALFTKRYGLIDADLDFDNLEPERNLPTEFDVGLATFVDQQHWVRRWWRFNSQADEWARLQGELQLEIDVRMAGGQVTKLDWTVRSPQIEFSASRRRRGVIISPRSLWQHICLSILLHKFNELRQCQNTSCWTPYFIAHRDSQLFCSLDCAGKVAKRRWWERHGEQWRQSRRK